MSPTHERVSFDSPHGLLAGDLQIPDSEIRGGVLLAHCFTCSKSYKITRYLADGIEAGGYAVLRFDFTGLGESGGDFADTSVTSHVDDLEAAARYMQSRGLGSCVMVGHSLGGAASLLAAGNVPEVRAVVTVAAPATADHVRHAFTDRDVAQALNTGRVDVRIAGRPFSISADFFQDLERHNTLDHITALNRPLLVVHGTADRIVSIEESEKIFAAARQPRWFAAIPEANHLFTNKEDAEKAARTIVSFLHAVL
ncbi:MAG: alpha/beta fold hydrolase [Gemmatimonadota bacterium]|nr:MAG: alpha/beta fold hydrolase [Gemmatimonadota bacterium]